MKVLYVCNDHAYFDAHRRWLADEAISRGMQVVVACGNVINDSRAASVVDFPLDVPRHSFDLKRDLALAAAVRRAVHQTKADVVHLITIKPILFGMLGMMFMSPGPRIIVTFPGLGRVFDLSERSFKARLRRQLVIWGLKFGLRSSGAIAIFEHEDDKLLLERLGVVDPHNAVHIAGAGVDPVMYPARPLPDTPLRLLFAGRLLKAKGVMTVVKAARIVREHGHDITFVVAGGEQAGDPDALNEAEMQVLRATPDLDYLGNVAPADMPALLASVHAVVLPTIYQEGVPRILIEAGAMGRPAIVSNNPGCKAFVAHLANGIVLDGAGSTELADAAIALAHKPGLLARLSVGASERVVNGGFLATDVGNRTLEIYDRRQ